ncbi:hypothetical protein ISG32_01515 [Diaphorobacter sp. NR2-3-3-1]|nr:hypothetical protein [Diaphorobacter caeni]
MSHARLDDQPRRTAVPAFKAQAVDATGAGDCFCGNLLARVAAGDDLVAAACGGFNCSGGGCLCCGAGGRGREFRPAAEYLFGLAQKGTKNALFNTRGRTRFALRAPLGQPPRARCSLGGVFGTSLRSCRASRDFARCWGASAARFLICSLDQRHSKEQWASAPPTQLRKHPGTSEATCRNHLFQTDFRRLSERRAQRKASSAGGIESAFLITFCAQAKSDCPAGGSPGP